MGGWTRPRLLQIMTDAAVLTYIELPPGDERRLPPLQTVVAAVRAGELSLQQLVQQLDGVLTSQGAAKRAGGTELLAPLPWPCCECSAVTAASAATPAPRGRLTGCQLCGAWLEWLTSRRLASRSPLAAALLSTVRPTGLRLELALLCCTLRRAVGREG